MATISDYFRGSDGHIYQLVPVDNGDGTSTFIETRVNPQLITVSASTPLDFTVQQVIHLALSKLGIDGKITEAKNIEDAHRNLNVMLGLWSADPDLAIGRIVPLAGYSELSDVIDLPPEYIAAIIPNLAVVLSSDFDQPVSKELAALAVSTLNLISIQNVRRISGRIPTNKR
jgi:hypothetical protein